MYLFRDKRFGHGKRKLKVSTNEAGISLHYDLTGSRANQDDEVETNHECLHSGGCSGGHLVETLDAGSQYNESNVDESMESQCIDNADDEYLNSMMTDCRSDADLNAEGLSVVSDTDLDFSHDDDNDSIASDVDSCDNYDAETESITTSDDDA